MSMLEHRIVAHHVGGRGFGVALNCPPQLANDLVHILYEADETCACEMMVENKNDTIHILPYCLGLDDRPGKIFITKNAYASSNFEPDPEYFKYYCEVHLTGEVDGVLMQDHCYDAIYGNEYRVVEVRDVAIRALDRIMAEGSVPQGLPPDFLSLDTQGSELNILRGAEKTFHDHCVALATEIEFHPMYRNQALFSQIFDFALGHGFHFAGFTYLQEISSNRLPVGARAKGVLAFGDALFFRRIDSVQSLAISENARYLKLLKLAFIALNFGYLEYALEVLEAAEQTKPDRELREQLMRRDCFRILYDLQLAARQLPRKLLYHDRSELAAELKKIQDRARAAAAMQPSGARSAPAESQRIRYLLFTNPPAAISKLYRHFFPPEPATVTRPSSPPTPTIPGEEVPVSPPTTPVEDVLAKYGYTWWADVVRQRRKSAERSMPGQIY